MDDNEYKQFKIKQYYKNKVKEKSTLSYYTHKRNQDVIYKIIGNLNTRINKIFKEKNIIKKCTYIDYLGIKPMDFKEYLLKMFDDKMNYNNYGLWEVDHKFPFSKINFNDDYDIKKNFHYTNLQPLWKEDNILIIGWRKGSIQVVEGLDKMIIIKEVL